MILFRATAEEAAGVTDGERQDRNRSRPSLGLKRDFHHALWRDMLTWLWSFLAAFLAALGQRSCCGSQLASVAMKRRIGRLHILLIEQLVKPVHARLDVAD